MTKHDKQFPIRINKQTYTLVKIKAALAGRSVASVIRRLLQKWLDGEVKL